MYEKAYELFTFIPFGEREVGNPYRTRIKSKEELERFIFYNNGVNPNFISISSRLNNLDYLITVPFDFDKNEIYDEDDTLNDAIKLYNFFNRNNVPTFLMYSGMKGFHVHAFVEINFYPNNIIRDFQTMVSKSLDLKTVDNHVFGQSNRLMRIPNTIHEKTGYEAIILKSNIKNGNLKPLNLSLFNDYDVDFLIYDREEKTNIPIHDYPCLEKYIKDEEPDHFIRYSWVLFRKLLGFSPEEIYEELEKIGRKYWVDFNEHMIWYQINHIYRGNYSIMPKCSKLNEFGFCLKEKCRYYESEFFEDRKSYFRRA